MTSEGTKKHIFRCPDDIWLPAVAVAAMRDENMSDVLRRSLEEYTRTRGAWPPDQTREG